MFLRDSGPLKVLERQSQGNNRTKERWVRRMCVLDKDGLKLKVYRMGIDVNAWDREPLVSIPLGGGSKIWTKGEEYHLNEFSIAFNGESLVARFLAESRDDLESWVCSLEMLGQVERKFASYGWENPLDAFRRDTPMEESREPTSKREEEPESLARNPLNRAKTNQGSVLKMEGLIRNGDADVLDDNEYSREDIVLIPRKYKADPCPVTAAPVSVRRACGYLLILTPQVSPNWRETFCILYEQYLLEFAFPGDRKPLFCWKLDPRLLPVLRQEPPGELKFPCVELQVRHRDSPIPKGTHLVHREIGETSALSLSCDSQQDVEDWYLSLSDVCRNFKLRNQVCQNEGESQQHIVPYFARYCARKVLAPFNASSRLSSTLASNAALALSITLRSGILEPFRVRASSTAQELFLFSLVTSNGELESLGADIVIQLVREGHKGIRNDLSAVGLDMIQYGKVKEVVESTKVLDLIAEVDSENGESSEEESTFTENRSFGPEVSLHQAARDWPALTLQAEVLCNRPGRFRLDVRYKKQPIFGSPFRVSVLPGRMSIPHCTFGLVTCIEGESNTYEIVVRRRDVFLNPCESGKTYKHPVLAHTSGPGKVVTVKDAFLQDAVVRFSSENLQAIKELSITINGQHIRGSPLVPSEHLGVPQSTRVQDLAYESSKCAILGRTVLAQVHGASHQRVGDCFMGAPVAPLGGPGHAKQSLSHSFGHDTPVSDRWAFQREHHRQYLTLGARRTTNGGEDSFLRALPSHDESFFENSLTIPDDLLDEVDSVMGHLELRLSPLREVVQIEIKNQRPLTEWKLALNNLSPWRNSHAKLCCVGRPEALWLHVRALRAFERSLATCQIASRSTLGQDISHACEVAEDLLRRSHTETRGF